MPSTLVALVGAALTLWGMYELNEYITGSMIKVIQVDSNRLILTLYMFLWAIGEACIAAVGVYGSLYLAGQAYRRFG